MVKQIVSALMPLVAASALAHAPVAEPGLEFHSSDSTLEATFAWAKDMAMRYSHADGDPVGPWYEAALPEREAFCMRDAAHQSVGAHLLGLTEQNLNMMTKFVSNISDSRDWCGYWEINRYDCPVPVDYRSDKEFWYNLNANHDVILSAWKLYNWTADSRYVSGKEFTDYYNVCVADFIDRWKLSPDSIMHRPQFMNRDPEIKRGTPYYACRGIPSYVEGLRGLCVGIDLIGSLYSGHRCVAMISRLNDSIAIDAATLEQRAADYRRVAESEWWDDAAGRYHTFYTESGIFAHGEGLVLALWFDLIKEGPRRDACVSAILEREWNIENMSYMPALLLDLGYPDEAYSLIATLPSRPRNDYPELSYALIEAIVRSGMGIAPDASDRSLKTEYRLTNIDATVSATAIPLFGGTIDLSHDGTESTTLTNHTSGTIKWTPTVGGAAQKTVKVGPGKTKTVRK